MEVTEKWTILIRSHADEGGFKNGVGLEGHSVNAESRPGEAL